jgi:hypothetical protein
MWLGDNSNSEGLSYMSARGVGRSPHSAWQSQTRKAVQNTLGLVGGGSGSTMRTRPLRVLTKVAPSDRAPWRPRSRSAALICLVATADNELAGKITRAGLSIARAFPQRARLTSVPIGRPLPGRSPSGWHTAVPHHSPAFSFARAQRRCLDLDASRTTSDALT